MRRVFLSLVLSCCGCGRAVDAEPASRGEALEHPAASEPATSPEGTPAGSDATTTPDADLRATSIAVGGATSYARMSDGTVRGWGDGDHFALGREDASAVGTPIEIEGVEHATAVFCGGLDVTTACATLEDGRVLCWGDRNGFPLGRDLKIEGVPATEVPALAGAHEITIGTRFGCAAMKDGTVRCWGQVPGWPSVPVMDHRDPVLVPGLTDVSSVRAGWSHVCALGKDGRVWCLGKNSGQRVAPTKDRMFTASEPTLVEGVEGAVELAASQHFSCARLGDGTLRCWGAEGVVQVAPSGVTPVALDGEAVALSSAGVGSHLCVILGDGTVRCAGYNRNGQLGIDSVGASNRMVAVPGLHDAVAVSASQTHTCALVRDGGAWCWGGNGRGGLGDGTLDDHAEPRPVGHLLDPQPPPPSAPAVVEGGPVETYEGLPEDCSHPTLALSLPGRDRTTFEVQSAHASIADDRKNAWIHLRDHGFDPDETFVYETPRGDQLHVELVLVNKKTIQRKRRDPVSGEVLGTEWVERSVRLEPSVYRTFPAWLALDSPRHEPTVDVKVTESDGPIVFEASPVRAGDTQEVTITRLGPDWICGTLAMSSPRGTLTGEFAARVRH